jgi:hypothetical protein
MRANGISARHDDFERQDTAAPGHGAPLRVATPQSCGAQPLDRPPPDDERGDAALIEGARVGGGRAIPP